MSAHENMSLYQEPKFMCINVVLKVGVYMSALPYISFASISRVGICYIQLASLA